MNQLSNIAIVTNLPKEAFTRCIEQIFAGQDGDKEEVLFSLSQKTVQLRKIIKTVVSFGGFIDDHTGRKVDDHPSYAVFAKGEDLHLVPLYGDGGFCLNPIELRGEIPHLSQWSCGGVVYTNNATLEGNLRDYNNGRENRPGDTILACAQKRNEGFAVKSV